MITFSCDLTMARVALIIANLYCNEADDFVITVGDWKPPQIEGLPPRFNEAIQLTLGDFRRWAPLHYRSSTT